MLGGLGIPVLGDLLLWPQRRKRLPLHSRITLALYAVLILLGTAGLLLAETQPGGTVAGQPLGRQVLLTGFQAISACRPGLQACRISSNSRRPARCSRWG